MRVELNFSKQGNSADLFLDILTQTYPDVKCRRLKGMTRAKLIIDAKFLNRTTNKTDLMHRIDDVLGSPASRFFVHELKIGTPVKCTVCDGTGKSTYPNDFFAKVPDEELK